MKIPDEVAVPAMPDRPHTVRGARRNRKSNKLFRMVMKLQASDLHLKVGQPPMMRLRGDIRRTEMRPLTQEDMERLFYPILNAKQRKILDEEGGVDFSWVVGQDECRFRVSLFKQRGRLSLVSRRVNNVIPNFADLGLPPIIEKLCKFPEGLVILAGVTGSGKSTTIASMLDYIAATEPLHILTVEDPIEFVFTDKMSYINQREIGLDSAIGTRRSRTRCGKTPTSSSSASCAISKPSRRPSMPPKRATWCSAPSTPPVPRTTINRIMDLFPPDKHPAIRQALANNLKAVVAQKLVKGIKKGARADQRNHDRELDDPEADRGTGRRQDPRRHPHRHPGRHGGFQRRT